MIGPKARTSLLSQSTFAGACGIAEAPRRTADLPMTDPLPLAQALIRCPSVTPDSGRALAVVEGEARRLGFAVHRVDVGDTPNLYARRGTGAPHVCFAGHTDVVPPGPHWRVDPFGGEIRDGVLIGRGACDMKGGIAAFLAAADRAERGSISLLITGDEEGAATDGTIRVLDWMAARGEHPDFCLVGEPTCRERLGDTVKIGRRGSLNATLTLRGVQGHVGYPERADNPIHALAPALAELVAAELDRGSAHFAPSTLQVTSVDVGNAARNVIPAEVRACLNIRFNDRHTPRSLEEWLRARVAAHAPSAAWEFACNAEPFFTEPGMETEALVRAITRATGVTPALDTGGGTSDARFIARHCKVAEFGLVGATMHKADEGVPVAELRLLAMCYDAILTEFGL